MPDWAAVGADAPAASSAAAASANLPNVLRAISPYLVIAALGASDDLDAVRRRTANDRSGRRRDPPDHRAPDRLRSGGDPRSRVSVSTRGRPRISGAAGIPACTVEIVAQVTHADGLDRRVVLLFARLSQHQAELPDLLRERELLRIQRVELERRGLGEGRLPVRALRILVDGNDPDVLEQDVGDLQGLGPAASTRDQNIDRVVGLDETGDARDVVDSDRGGALAVREERGDRRALAFTGDLGREDRFVDLHRAERDAALPG